MANKDHFTESLDDFNPYYAPYYDSDNGKKSKSPSSRDKKSKSDQKNSEGKNLLRRAENSSMNPINRNQVETNSPWKNNVQGKPLPTAPGIKSIKFTNGNKKKSIALIAILVILIGGGVFLSSTNALLPGAMNSLFTMNSNSSYSSYILRSAKIQQYMLKNLNVTTTNRGLTRYTKISNSLRTRLANNNIDIEGSGDSTVLKWKQTATDGTVTVKTIPAGDFDNEFLNNADFRNDYNKARRNRIITFYDKNGDDYFTQRGNDRNMLKNLRETGDTETDADEYNKIMSQKFDNDQTTTDLRGLKDDYDSDGNPIYETDESGRILYDSDGNPIPKRTTGTDTVAQSNTNNTRAEAEVKANSFISDIAQTASRVASVANTACALYKVGSAVALAITSIEKIQASNYFLGPMESINKMMAGKGDSSGINTVMNFLTTSTTSSVTDFNTLTVNGIDSDEPSSSVGEISVTGSPLQSQGFQKNLAGAPVDRKNIANYSSNRISSSISKALNMTTSAVHTCNAIQATAAVVSIAVTIGTFGASSLVSIAGNFLLSLGIGLTASAFLSFLIPTLAQVLFSNVFENVTGIPAGELFAKGASVTNFGLGRSASGQVPATKEAVLQYNNSTVKTVAALDAEIDRATLSPFDTSSPNTFFGSIAYNILGVSTSGTFSAVNTILRTTSKAIGTITGRVSAEGEDSDYLTTFGECSNEAEEQGYDACDIYGESIRISSGLTNMEPDDPTYLSVIENNTNEDGSIKDGSNLANFIIANVESVTDPGVVNTEVLAANEAGNVFVNAVPIIGDLFDIYNAAQDEKSLGWATCQYCGNSPKNPLWESEVKYFAQYVEDQRILDEMSDDGSGQSSTNPVTAFIEKYREEHPLDNSPAGYLAHITGLPKTTAEDIIALADYYQFIENYDTSNRIAMVKENTTIQPAESIIARFEDGKIDFSEKMETETSEEIFLAKQSEQYIIYANLRNRSFAA